MNRKQINVFVNRFKKLKEKDMDYYISDDVGSLKYLYCNEEKNMILIDILSELTEEHLRVKSRIIKAEEEEVELLNSLDKGLNNIEKALKSILSRVYNKVDVDYEITKKSVCEGTGAIIKGTITIRTEDTNCVYTAFKLNMYKEDELNFKMLFVM